MKINLFVINLIIILIQACGSHLNISGKYMNKNDPKVINYLQLNNDMTYVHFYKKNNITFSQKGTWEYQKEPYEAIDLFQFCNYNENGENYKKFGIYTLIIDGKRLNTGFDGNNESSFEKE